MNFFDQYKHPNWQKKRLEVLEAAGFECESCGSVDEQLHVHHKRYIKGRKIWEYSTKELAVLCESCHAETHHAKKLLDEILADAPICEVLSLVAGFLQRLEIDACLSPDAKNSPLAFHAGEVAYTLSAMNVNFTLELFGKIDQMYAKWLKDQKIGGFDA